MADLMMSVKEVAQYLGVCDKTIYRAVEDGTLPHIKIRRTIRIPCDALDTYLKVPAHDKKPTTTTVGKKIVTRL